MPRNAKAYIALILCAGATILLLAARSWSSANLLLFLVFLGFAAFSSTLKVRIPGIEGTMSPNFAFLLLAMAFCSYSQVMAITLVAALVQSLWAAKTPRLVQVTFSAAAMLVSASIAFQSSLFLFGPGPRNSPVAFVIFAGSLYLAFNTALVAAVIGLVEGKPLAQVARICLECVFPYFAAGILFAGMVSGAFNRSTAWASAIALFPVAALGYLYSVNRTAKVAPAAMESRYTNDEELVEVGTHLRR